jgi:hypothetical protein
MNVKTLLRLGGNAWMVVDRWGLRTKIDVVNVRRGCRLHESFLSWWSSKLEIFIEWLRLNIL